jgi:hypothetical protein
VLGIPSPLGVRTMSGDTCLCGCGSKCDLSLPGLQVQPRPAGLGAATQMTSQAALQQAQQGVANLNPRDFQNPTWLSSAYSQIEAGQFDITAFDPNCGSQAAPNLNLFSTVSGLSLQAATVGTSIATATTALSATTGIALGAATMGVGLIISVIGMIFAHHASAVKQEQQIGCASLAAFNNAMSVISSAVANGQTTPAAAAASLDSLYSSSRSYISPSWGTSPYCNANCEMSIIAQAMVIYWKAAYAASAAASAAPPPAPVTASTVSQPGSGSAGSGPVNAPIVASGSILTVPQTSAPSPAASMPWWAWLAAAAVGFVVVREAF